MSRKKLRASLYAGFFYLLCEKMHDSSMTPFVCRDRYQTIQSRWKDFYFTVQFR